MQTELRDNPYVAVIAKKQRNLKKKMEKILKIESQILSGKAVDEEQKIMYTTKSSVEKSLADLKGIQSALEEVAKEEQDKTGGNQSSSAQIGSSEETKDYDPLVIPSQKPVAIIESTSVYDSKSSSEVVEKLLKTFQVVHRFESVTNKPLPVAVSALGQALIGDVAAAQAVVQDLFENAELFAAVDELFNELTVSLMLPAPTAAVETAAVEGGEPVQDSPAAAGEKAPRRRNRKRGPQSVAVDTVVADGSTEGAQLETEASANKETVEVTTPAPQVAPVVAAEPLPLSEVVSSIPLPSPAAIVAATADNMLVPKRSFEAATAAVLAESVEINFFPVATAPKPVVAAASGESSATVAAPPLPLPPVHPAHVQPEAFYLAHDPAYLAHMAFQPPLQAGPGPVNSLLAGIPGFGDYSYPHHQHLGYAPGPVGAPFVAPADVQAAPVTQVAAGEGEGKKRRNRTRKGSKDVDAAAAAGTHDTSSVSPAAQVESAPVAVAPVVAAPVVVPAVVTPAPAIVPVMGVGAALRYLEGLAASNAAAAAAASAPAVAATESTVQSEGVEGALPKRVRRRRGKGGADGEGAAAEDETPAAASPVTVATSVPITPAPSPAVVAPAAPAAAVVETAVTAEGEEEARPRRVRGSRGKGGRGKVGAEGAAESAESSNSSSAAAPASAAVATSTPAPVPAVSHARSERPKPAAPAATGVRSEAPRAPRERRDGDNDTNNNNNTTTTNKERGPRPATATNNGDRAPRAASGANGGANGDRPRTARPPQPQSGDALRNPRPTTAGAGASNRNTNSAAPKAASKPANTSARKNEV